MSRSEAGFEVGGVHGERTKFVQTRPNKAGPGARRPCGQQPPSTSSLSASHFPPYHPSAPFTPFTHTSTTMDQRGDQRPPRAARPGGAQRVSQSRSSAPQYPDQSAPPRPAIQPSESKAGVSFRHIEQGDRTSAVDGHRQRNMPSAYQPHLAGADPEHPDQFDPSRVGRKKSLVRPDREKIDPGHRQWHYRNHVAQLEEEGHARVGVMPSSVSSSSHHPHSCILRVFSNGQLSSAEARSFITRSRRGRPRIRSRSLQTRCHPAKKTDSTNCQSSTSDS